MERNAALRAWFVTTSPGGLGAPPYGHYDPCARSSLNGPDAVRPGTQARPGAGKCRKWSAERRASVSQTEAVRLASVPGGFAHRPGCPLAPCVSRRSASLNGEAKEMDYRRARAFQEQGRRSVGYFPSFRGARRSPKGEGAASPEYREANSETDE